jgi:hypothetical protein
MVSQVSGHARAMSLLNQARKARAANANRPAKVQVLPFTPQSVAPSSGPPSDETEEAAKTKADKRYKAVLSEMEAVLDECDECDRVLAAQTEADYQADVSRMEAFLAECDREDWKRFWRKTAIRDMKARKKAKSVKSWRHFFRRRGQKNLI